MSSKHIFTLLLSMNVIYPFTAWPQVADSLFPNPDGLLENRMEEFSSTNSGEIDFSQWLDELELLKIAPVNLNSTSVEDLHRLPFLNEQHLTNLNEYIKEYGLIASIYELQGIDGFNESFIEQIEPYITLDFSPAVPFRLSSALHYGHSKLEIRYHRVLEPQSGYAKVSDSIRKLKPSQFFSGSPDGIGIRYRFAYRDQLQFGIMAEKDAGETFIKGPDSIPKGFDYYSGHIYLKNTGIISHLAIGDYQAQFGQGLTLTTGISMGMMAGMLPSRKRSDLIKPHNSFNENSYLRGIAAGVKLKDISITVLFSHRKKDGNQVVSDSADSFSYISALQETGYHRTLSEITDRKSVTEQLWGTYFQWSQLRWKIGGTCYHLSYSAPVIRQSVVGSGNHLTEPAVNFAGIDYCYSFKRLILYGEYSKQLKGGYAFIHGLNLSVHPMLAIAAVFRSYGPNYSNLFSSGFGNASSHTREYALYQGIEATFRKFSITAFADFERFKGLQYRVDSPSRRSVLGLELLYPIGRKGEIRIRYRNALNPANISTELTTTQKVDYTQRLDYQWSLSYQPLHWLKTGNKIYINSYKKSLKGITRGYFISQDLKIHFQKSQITLTTRYSMFDTDSYDSRIYSYESDLPSSFSVPAMSGRGSRFYIMINAPLLKNTEFWVRFSYTRQDEIPSISEGATEISKDHKSEIRAMISVKI